MAVFVRIFRLAMLFFNVYDSYKILKFPPPSTSNKGKPSVRAMSQRKRDMKGCLAVWIVWSCFIIYERFTEAVISLFIPFYDEFKSLVLLFLIMTRARGAEPIYLHIIRPFLKPYTSTIDQLLDFAHVVGDLVFGLAALPFVYALEWWKRRFGTESECLDTETDASSSPVSPASAPETRPPANRASTSKPARVATGLVPKPRQPASRPSFANPTEQKKAPTQTKVSQAQPADKEAAISSHDLPMNDTTQPDGLLQVDEWRQYPAFPSAYPPTPLLKQTQIAAIMTVSASTPLYPPIPEEPAQQGFRQSLLPPHDDLDPSYVDGKSDDVRSGIQPEESQQNTVSVMDVDGKDALDEPTHDEVDEYESEDDFNITLRTPDAPLRILTSLGLPRPLSSEISPLSLPVMSALTTADGESSLYSPSTESYVSEDASAPPPSFAGHKRTLQPASTITNTRVRSSHTMIRGTTRMARGAKSPTKRPVVNQRRPQRPKQIPSNRILEELDSPEPENERPSTDPSLESEDLTSKRRRVSLLPPTAVQVTGPARRRVVRPTSISMLKATRAAPAHKISSVRPSTRA